MNRVGSAELVTDLAGLRDSAGGQLGPTEWTEMAQRSGITLPPLHLDAGRRA